MIDQVGDRNRLTTGEGVETTLAARQFARTASGFSAAGRGSIVPDLKHKDPNGSAQRPDAMAPGTLRRKEAPHAVLWPSRTTVRLNGDCALAAKENPMAFRHQLRLLPIKRAFAYSGNRRTPPCHSFEN